MIAIIAIGSAFNDDSISWRIIESITPDLKRLADEINIIFCDSPGTQLIHQLQPLTHTILIDALVTDSSPGNVIELELDELLNSENLLSSHELSVANILQLANNLGKLPENLWILGINIETDRLLTEQQSQLAGKKLYRQIKDIVDKSSR